MLSNRCDYAVNKTDPEAIVCRSVTGENVRLTREHFDSDEEFQKWKAWSDEDYRNAALRERAFNDRRYSFELDHLLDRHEYSDWLSAELKGSEKLKKGEIISIIRSILTDTQFRRLWQRFACEYELAEIASSEGVSVTAVVDAIRYAMKRLKSIKFSTHLKTYDAARDKANNKCQSKSNAHNRDGSQQQNCKFSVNNFIRHKTPCKNRAKKRDI